MSTLLVEFKVDDEEQLNGKLVGVWLARPDVQTLGRCAVRLFG